MKADSTNAWNRLEDRIAAWGVLVERTAETETAILAFGERESLPVVVKVATNQGDEWRSAEILDAFNGEGFVRVYERAEGAMLLERLRPATPLVSLVMDGRDDEATEVLADLIGRMAPGACATAPTVRDWGKAFDWYVSSGDTNIDRRLVVEARDVYTTLCDSQASPRLLHGDFHHYNVLWDAGRGWVAIDPKGVIGEVEYEAGAALRNPFETPDLLVDPVRIASRVNSFARRLRLDPNRLLAWGFAQAVLSAVWLVEDGLPVDGAHSSIRLARAMRPMLTHDGLGSAP